MESKEFYSSSIYKRRKNFKAEIKARPAVIHELKKTK